MVKGKYYYEVTPKRKRCKTICKYTKKYVGSIDCRNNCEHHQGYGRDEKGKYVKCERKIEMEK